VQLSCAHCGYNWNYRGKSEYYATCPKCFPGDTVVGGSRVPISMMKTYDIIYDRTGAGRVLRVNRHRYDGDILVIGALGLLDFRVTPEHPLFVSHRTDGRLQKAHWLPAYKLMPAGSGAERVDYLLVPSLHNHTHHLPHKGTEADVISEKTTNWSNEDLRSGISIEDAKSEGRALAQQMTTQWANYSGISSSFSPDSQTRRLVTKDDRSSLNISEFSASLLLMSHSLSKEGAVDTNQELFIPQDILLHPDISVRRAFLEGLLSNCPVSRSNSHRRIVSSAVLATQIQLMYAGLGRFAALHRVKPDEDEAPADTSLNTDPDLYSIDFSKEGTLKGRSGFWVPVTHVRRFHFSGPVYNLETSDGCYLVSNALVHNCLYKVRIPRNEKNQRIGRKRGEDELK